MKKTKKQVLPEHLMKLKGRASAESVMRLSNSENLGIQVKTLDSEGNFVIKFSSSDPWIKPSEWLHNYQVSIKERYEEAAAVYHSLFPQENSGLQTVETDEEKDELRKQVKLFHTRWTGLLAAYNLSAGKTVMDGFTYGADIERAKSKFDKVLEERPKWTNVSLLVQVLLGREMMTCTSINPELDKYIRQKVSTRKAQLDSQASSQSKSE